MTILYPTTAEGACAFYRSALEVCTLIPDERGVIARKALEQLDAGADLLAHYRELVARTHFSCWAILTLEGYAWPMAGLITEETHLRTAMICIDTPGQGLTYELLDRVQDVRIVPGEEDVRLYLRGLGLPGELARAVGNG